MCDPEFECPAVSKCRRYDKTWFLFGGGGGSLAHSKFAYQNISQDFVHYPSTLEAEFQVRTEF